MSYQFVSESLPHPERSEDLTPREINFYRTVKDGIKQGKRTFEVPLDFTKAEFERVFFLIGRDGYSYDQEGDIGSASCTIHLHF